MSFTWKQVFFGLGFIAVLLSVIGAVKMKQGLIGAAALVLLGAVSPDKPVTGMA